MDITTTEALIGRMRRDGWDITANAYKYDFAGVYVSATTERGNVFISKSSPQVNLNLARQVAEYLTGLPGITNVAIGGQAKNGDILVMFDCAEFRGNWAV